MDFGFAGTRLSVVEEHDSSTEHEATMSYYIWDISVLHRYATFKGYFVYDDKAEIHI